MLFLLADKDEERQETAEDPSYTVKSIGADPFYLEDDNLEQTLRDLLRAKRK